MVQQEGGRDFCFDKCGGFDLNKHLQNTSSGSGGCAAVGDFCHKPLDPRCVQRGLVDSLVTRYYLCVEMCNGWVEREAQEGRNRMYENEADSSWR